MLKRSKMKKYNLEITETEMECILDMVTSIETMIGCSDNDGQAGTKDFDKESRRNLKNFDKMLKRNGLTR